MSSYRNYRRTRYARYIRVKKPSDLHEHHFVDVSFSTDHQMWSCICLTKHELKKLLKLLNKYLQDENLSKRL